MSEMVGCPLKADEANIISTILVLREFSVEVDLTVPVPSYVFVVQDEFSYWQQVKYCNLLLYFIKCRKHGHKQQDSCMRIFVNFNNGSILISESHSFEVLVNQIF